MTIRNSRVTKRLVAVAAAAALSTTLLVLPTSPVSATASPAATVRIAGLNRYLTSNAVATASHGGATNLTKFVLASGTSCADGLSAASLAGALGAPLLLTPGDVLSPLTLGQMQGMSADAATAKYVVIVGGVNAVSKAVADQLTATGYIVSRMDGATRYATADAVAAATKLNNGVIGSFGGYRTAFLASGTNFADALSASGYSYENKIPVFLTDGDTLSAGTAAEMKAAGVQQVIVLGGVNAVSDAVLTAAGLVSGVIVTKRIGGADRYETATLLATAIGVDAPAFKLSALLVSGTDCPDALAASQYAKLTDSVILPVKADSVPTAISAWLATNQLTVGTLVTIGGTTAVSNATVAAAKLAATITAPTASIVTSDGSVNATVTFSAQMNAGDAGTITNYTRTTATGVVTDAATATYSYVALTGVSKTDLTFATALNPGDTIRVLGNAINHVTIPNLKVASATATVTASTTAPTGAITAYSGAAGAATAWVTVSLNGVASFEAGDLVHVPAALGATAATFNCAGFITNTTTNVCTSAGAVIGAGDTVTIAAGELQTAAFVPVKNAAITATAVTDITPPTLVSTRYTTGALGGALASASTTGGTGVLQVKARAGGAAEGKAGNAWSVTVAQETTTSVTVNSVTKVVTVGMDITEGNATQSDVANVLNANAAFSALFVANSTTDGTIEDTVIATTALTTGADAISIVATFSEPLSSALIGDFTFTGFTVSGPAAIKTVIGTDDGRLIGVLTLTGTSADVILPGVDTVTAAVAILDRNSVAVTGTAAARTVPMIAG